MIRDDSIFLNQMAIRQVANYFGLPTVDTIRLGLFKVHEGRTCLFVARLFNC